MKSEYLSATFAWGHLLWFVQYSTDRLHLPNMEYLESQYSLNGAVLPLFRPMKASYN